MKVGIPCLQLKQTIQSSKCKHAGSAYHVACEALEERYSSDPDIKRELTEHNKYEGFTSGKDLFRYWQEEKDNHKFIDKNGNEKKARSDISIGFACIVKPPAEWINAQTEEEQRRFFVDSDICIKTILTKAGLQIDSRVTHLDEQGAHDHYFCHDPEYQMSKKVGLKLFTAFNKTYPEMMREKGWYIENNITYDNEEAKKMTASQKKEYKEACMSKKKLRKSGLSSYAYKRARDYESAYQEALSDAQTDIATEQNNNDIISAQLDIQRKKVEAERRAIAIEKAKLLKQQAENNQQLKAKAFEIIRDAEIEAERKKMEAQRLMDKARMASIQHQKAEQERKKLEQQSQQQNSKKKSQQIINAVLQKATDIEASSRSTSYDFGFDI